MFFFFNDTATTEIYTLSLHDALPISARASRGCRSTPPIRRGSRCRWTSACTRTARSGTGGRADRSERRSEEHTSELQSLAYLVCRLLLEKKKKVKGCRKH